MGGFRRKGLILTAGSLVFPAALVLFAFSHSFWLSSALLSVVGLAFVAQNAICNTLIQAIVPDSLRGRVMAVYMLMFFGTTPFGALQAGTVAQALGPAAGVAVGAGITLAFALFVLLAAPFLRRLEV
jgi:predicted MFS family arabinose efflux permease